MAMLNRFFLKKKKRKESCCVFVSNVAGTAHVLLLLRNKESHLTVYLFRRRRS